MGVTPLRPMPINYVEEIERRDFQTCTKSKPNVLCCDSKTIENHNILTDSTW